MKRAALLAIPAAALALAILPPSRPSPSRVYMPVFPNVPSWMLATALPARTATPGITRPVLWAGDWRTLEKALMVPGALVVAKPGEYRPSRVLHMAPGVTLEAFGAVLRDRGLYLNKAPGATIRGLTVSQVTGDGIQVSRSRDVLIDRVKIDRPGDGALDIVEGPTEIVAGREVWREAWVTVRDSILSDSGKCSLIGDQDQPQDAMLRVRLERVTFVRCGERSPKVQHATVWIIGGTVSEWGGTAVDARHNARVHVSGTRFNAGKASAARFQQSLGGIVFDDGTNPFQPWGMQ